MLHQTILVVVTHIQQDVRLMHKCKLILSVIQDMIFWINQLKAKSYFRKAADFQRGYHIGAPAGRVADLIWG